MEGRDCDFYAIFMTQGLSREVVQEFIQMGRVFIHQLYV